jgi:hypothetical protein
VILFLDRQYQFLQRIAFVGLLILSIRQVSNSGSGPPAKEYKNFSVCKFVFYGVIMFEVNKQDKLLQRNNKNKNNITKSF